MSDHAATASRTSLLYSEGRALQERGCDVAALTETRGCAKVPIDNRESGDQSFVAALRPLNAAKRSPVICLGSPFWSASALPPLSLQIPGSGSSRFCEHKESSMGEQREGPISFSAGGSLGLWGRQPILPGSHETRWLWNHSRSYGPTRVLLDSWRNRVYFAQTYLTLSARVLARTEGEVGLSSGSMGPSTDKKGGGVT